MRLTQMLGAGLIAGASALALTPAADAGDYVRDERFGLFGAGHRITYTHTETVMGFVQRKAITGYDCCGRAIEGKVLVQQPVEVITSQCTRTYVDWDRSVVAAPGNLLKAVGNAITPKRRCDVPMYIGGQPCCQPEVQMQQVYPAPVQQMQPTPAVRPQKQSGPRLAPSGDSNLPNSELQVPPEPVPDTGRR